MTNVIKFQAPFEKIKQYSNSPYANLRKAIITQAIIDASNSSSDKTAKKFEIEAKNWLFGPDSTFEEICIDADLNPSFIRKIARSVIKLHKNNNTTKNNRNISKQKSQTLERNKRRMYS